MIEHPRLWGRSTVWGKKSILDPTLTTDQFELMKAERDRDDLRFCVLLLGIPAIAMLIAVLVTWAVRQ